jgi:hypothetical protein
MNFSVDYEKLGEVGKYLIQKGEEIDNLYSELYNICKSIDENWKSEDSSVYVWKIVNYLNQIIKENEQIINTGNLLNKLSDIYNEEDNNWDKELLREEQKENE